LVCDGGGYAGEVNMYNFATVTGVGFATPRIRISSIKSLVVNNV